MCIAISSPTRERAVTPVQLIHAFEDVREELLSTLFFILGNQEDAQDAAQEAFLKCWRYRRQMRGVRNVRAWIFRVGLNAAKDLRRNAFRRRARPLSALSPTTAFPGPSPSDLLLHREQTHRLRTALRDLRGEEKEVFLLRQNGDLTYEQVAHVTRRPVGTVKTQMRTALQKLRQVLRERDLYDR